MRDLNTEKNLLHRSFLSTVSIKFIHFLVERFSLRITTCNSKTLTEFKRAMSELLLTIFVSLQSPEKKVDVCLNHGILMQQKVLTISVYFRIVLCWGFSRPVSAE